jgi:hypothetical protein
MTSDRTFKGKIGSNTFGRYNSSGPTAAASKAFSRLCKEKDIKGNQKVEFAIVETTGGSQKKEHLYVGRREKLKTPIVRELPNGEKITIRYKNKIVSKK